MTKCYPNTAFLLRRTAREVHAMVETFTDGSQALAEVGDHLLAASRTLATMLPLLDEAQEMNERTRAFCEKCRQAAESDDLDEMIRLRDDLVRSLGFGQVVPFRR